MTTHGSTDPARSSVVAALRLLADLGDQRADPALQAAVRALQAVHDLWPGADALAERGSAWSSARIQVNNAIADALSRAADDAAGTESDGNASGGEKSAGSQAA